MGPLTESMTRLCGEIVAFRGIRKAFVNDLTRNTAALMARIRQENKERRAAVTRLRKAFAADLKGARRAWAGK